MMAESSLSFPIGVLVYCGSETKESYLKTFILGLVIGVVLFPLLVYAYFATGSAPVATSAPPMLFEKMLAAKALDARVAKEMPKSVPVPATEPNYVAGAQVYKENCSVCHGLPLDSPTSIAKGMFPKPPQLFRGKGVTDDEPGETYWKVANGIRLTGMPGFSQSLSETQMWQVSLLLANADKLPDAAKQVLVTGAPQVPATGGGQIPSALQPTVPAGQSAPK
jgi:mono/diheme cytochrome c family protein